jgi:hypothetical protein
MNESPIYDAYYLKYVLNEENKSVPKSRWKKDHEKN